MHHESREGWTPELIRKPGLAPATVIDVGAGAGMPALYQAFPGSYLVLIEPLRERRQDLRRVAARYGGEHVMCAVGSRQGTVTIHVEQGAPVRGSILERSRAGEAKGEDREIPVTTLDELRGRLDWQPPFGLKIDAAGYEYDVIRGATELLKETQFVIVEISTRPKRSGEHHSFEELVSLMDGHGFRLCDVLDAPRHQEENEPQHVDAMFLRADDSSPVAPAEPTSPR